MSISLWSSRTSNDNDWWGVTYGTPNGVGLFVAIASSGTGNRVMTSPDGINWTLRTSAANNTWSSITYGNGLFVAVAISGTGNRVMTSPNGINWTLRTSAADNDWWGVTYGTPNGVGLFVAVASSGTGNRVMTSPDGINWTLRTSAADSNWFSVVYGNGLFVAVAAFFGVKRVMTSPDGIKWTLRTSAADSNNWVNVTYGTPNGFGLFVAVGNNRIMTSPDGINWTLRTTIVNINIWCVCYGNGLFVAVFFNTGNIVLTSSDGITWNSMSSAASNSWRGVIYGNGLFVAVAESGLGNRVMTATTLSPTITNFSIPTKRYGDAPFTITQPTSNSSGSFSYTSSNLSVATISGNIITIVGDGNSIIATTQRATTAYTSITQTTTFLVDKALSNVTLLMDKALSNVTLLMDNVPISNICFPAATPITCDQGNIPIEKINPDIHTIRNKKIVGITKTITQDKYLVCFEKGALGINLPSQKTIISKNHKIFYQGIMIKAKKLVGINYKVYKTKCIKEIVYNVLLEKHYQMAVNNLICETLHPENGIAILYRKLQKLNPEEQNDLINNYNECVKMFKK